jgi:hypothetical protein
MNWVENMTEQILESQSFNYKNFIESRNKITLNLEEGEKYVEYDRCSFYVYSSNLSNDEKSNLWNNVYKQFYKKITDEYEKERKEYLQLCRFINMKKSY